MEHLPTPAAPRNTARLVIAALTVVILALAAAALAFQTAAAPHVAAYSNALRSSTPSASPLPPEQRLQLRQTPEPLLQELVLHNVGHTAQRATSAKVFNKSELWRLRNGEMTGQRVLTWRDQDGSGYVTTLTLAPIPAAQWHPAMAARTSLEGSTTTHEGFTASDRPYPHWPSTLDSHPHEQLAQLETIRPGIDTPADLMRAIATAHTRYFITGEVRAATLTLLGGTEGITVRSGDIPTYALDNPPMPGLIISASDADGAVTFHMDATTGYLYAAIEHAFRGGAGRRYTSSHRVFLEVGQRVPPPWNPDGTPCGQRCGQPSIPLVLPRPALQESLQRVFRPSARRGGPTWSPLGGAAAAGALSLAGAELIGTARTAIVLGVGLAVLAFARYPSPT